MLSWLWHSLGDKLIYKCIAGTKQGQEMRTRGSPKLLGMPEDLPTPTESIQELERKERKRLKGKPEE